MANESNPFIEAARWKAAYQMIASGLSIDDAERVAVVARDMIKAASDLAVVSNVSLHQAIDAVDHTLCLGLARKRKSRKEENVKEAKFKVGDLVCHKASGEKGVIVHVDMRCTVHPEFYAAHLAGRLDECVLGFSGTYALSVGLEKDVVDEVAEELLELDKGC